MSISHSFLLRMRNVSHKICRENQNTHFMFSNFFFFRKSCRLWDNVGKYSTAEEAADDDMAHAHYILDTCVYRHTIRICNTYGFPTITVIARTHLTVTLYVSPVYFWFIVMFFVSVVSKIGFLVTVWLSFNCSFVSSGCVWRVFEIYS